MTAQKTSFAGITALSPGDPLSEDGYAFQFGDRYIIDRLLRLGAVSHVHDAHAALANPTVQPTISANTSGGSIPSDQSIYVCYTWFDSNGGESAPCDAVSLTTVRGLRDPLGAPTAAVDYSGGALLQSSVSYAVTLTDGLGGETIIGPSVTVDIAPGNPNAQVALSGLAAIVANANVGSLAGAGWRLWRQIGGGPWYLIGSGTGDTFEDTGIAGDCTVAPPYSSTVNGANELLVTVPVPPTGVQAEQFAVYASYDGSFISPALLGVYPITDAGAAKVFTDLALSDGSPPAISQSFPGAHQLNPDAELIFGLKSPVTTMNNLPAGNRGDVRVAADTGHIYAVLGTSATVPADWTDLTPGVKGGGSGIGVAGPGSGSAWDTVHRFDGGQVPECTGVATGMNVLAVPQTTRVGDLMLMALATYTPSGVETLAIAGWDLVATGVAQGGVAGAEVTVTVYSRVATADDIGWSYSRPNYTFVGAIRSYPSAGVAQSVVRITGSVTPPQEVVAIDNTKPFQVNFIGMSSSDADSPMIALTGPTRTSSGSGLTALATDDAVGGQAVETATIETHGGVTLNPASDDAIRLVNIGVTLLPGASTAVGALADFAVPSTPQPEGALTIANGLLTTNDPTEVQVAGGVATGDKYAAQWTAPGQVADGHKVRAHFYLSDPSDPNSSHIGKVAIASLVVNMQDGQNGLAFWFGGLGVGWTTDLRLLGTVQSDVGNHTTGQDVTTLTAGRTYQDIDSSGVVPVEVWAEVLRQGNTVHGFLYDSDPAQGARPIRHLTYDVTGNASYGPTVAGYFGWTADYLGSKYEGVQAMSLYQLNTAELIMPSREALDFQGTGGVAVQVVDLDGTDRGNDLIGRGAQIVIDGSGVAGGAGAAWFAYSGAGTPAAGTFTGEKDGDFAVRESDGEIFERVAGAWVDQAFSIRGPQGVQGPAGTGGSGTTEHWFAYTGAGVPPSGTFAGEADGDWCIRESDGEVFQRVAGAWTDQGFSLRGPAGAAGAAGARGSEWFSYTGAGTPAAGTFTGEANGDFALRTSDGEVFERVAGAWVDQGFSIKGAAGSGGGGATDPVAYTYHTDFSTDVVTSGDLINGGTNNLAVAGGTLNNPSAADGRVKLLLSKASSSGKAKRDYVIQCKVIPASTNPDFSLTFGDHSLWAQLNSNTIALKNFTGGGITADSQTLHTAIVSGTPFWLRAECRAGVVRAEYWLKDPATRLDNDAPDTVATAIIDKPIAYGSPGIRMNTADSVDDFYVWAVPEYLP